jgi:hypothetical protein
MCQRQSGGAFQIWAMIQSKGLILISGQLKEYESSENVRRSSCLTCSSHLFFRYLNNDARIFVTTASLDDYQVQPNTHIWVSSKIDWLCLNDSIPQKSAE